MLFMTDLKLNVYYDIKRLFVCVFVFCPQLFPHRDGRILALISACPSYHLTSSRKSALIQKSSA